MKFRTHIQFENAQELIEQFHSPASVPRLNVGLPRNPSRRKKLSIRTNEKGYRADSFTERGDANLAFIGCSWVEGLGVSDGEIFSDQTAKLFSKATGLSTKSWNLGRAGSGIDYVLRMMPSICKTLIPDFLLLVISTFDRREYFMPYGRKHMFLKTQLKRIEKGTMPIPEEEFRWVYALNKLNNEYENIAHVLRTFRSIQGILETAGIPWLFTSIEHPGAANPTATLLELGALPADNYLGCVFERSDWVAEGNSHPGPKSHLQFAERIVERLISMELLSKGDKKG